MLETKSHAQTSSARLPLTMPGTPLVGNLFEFGKDPLAFMRKAISMGEPVVDFSVPGEKVSLVTSAEMSHQILVKHYLDFKKADRDVGVMAHVMGAGLVTNNNYDLHKKQRKLAQPGFHFRRIQSYAQTMIDYTYLLSKDWSKKEVRDVNDDMFRLTLYIVSKTLFNNDIETMSDASKDIGQSMHELQLLMNTGFKTMFVLPRWMPMPGQKKLARARKRLIDTIQKMIDARRNADGSFESGDDLLSMLLEARYEDGSSMSEDLLMDELITLLSAGHETTSNTMTWTLYLIAAYPNVQQRLRDEVRDVLNGHALTFEHLEQLTYVEQVIKEAMRLFPPAWTLNTRQANRDVVIDGIRFDKGKHVFISPYTNHFNPAYFPDPEKFDPERFSTEEEAKLPRYAYMPFGGGNRVCIGNSFAMMENKIILAILASQFTFSLCEQTKIELQPHVTLSNKDGMWLSVERQPV